MYGMLFRQNWSIQEKGFLWNKCAIMKTEKKTTGSRFKKDSRQVKKKKNALLNVLLVFFVLVFVVSGSMFVYEFWIKDTLDRNGINALLGDADIGFSTSDESENTLGDSSNGLDSDTSEIKYVSVDEIDLDNINFLTLNFSTLRNTNKNIKGWFYLGGPASIKGLPISNPLLQGTDYEMYLSKDYLDKDNSNGSIYVDYRSDMQDIRSNRNIVIYGHARSYLKFGGLKYLDEATRWYSDANNHFIFITTEHEKTVWQIFSWYETTADEDYRTSYFSSDEKYVSYLEELQSRNTIPSLKKFDFSAEDTIITLSTCKTLDKNKRVAVHAKLVKYEAY